MAFGLGAIVLVGFLLRAPALFGPFGFGWQHLGAFYGMQARNMVDAGPVATRFAGVVNAAPSAPQDFVHYTHHPPGHVWLLAASVALLGKSAFAIKLPGVLAALVQIVVTFALVARSLTPRAGLVAALLTATLPAGAYFSTHGSELGPAAMAAMLLALWLDERVAPPPAHA